MPVEFGHVFHAQRFRLTSGGFFDFDAVSSDGSVVASISTSGAATASGKNGVGKLQKIRSDVLFLTLAEADRSIIILTERDMYERCMQESVAGRLPECVEFCLVEVPEHLISALKQSRARASREVSPSASSIGSVSAGGGHGE